MTSQIAVTVFAKIDQDQLDDLRVILEQINADVESNRSSLFQKVQHLHFARFVLLDEVSDLDGTTITPSLVFMANCDLPAVAFLRHLVEEVPEGLDAIFSSCVDFPEPKDRNTETRLAYLAKRLIPHGSFYVNTIGRPVAQIRQEAALHDAIEDFLDGRDWKGQSGVEIRSTVQDFVFGNLELAWAKKSAQTFGLWWRFKEWFRLLFFVLLGLMLGLLLFPLILIWILLLRAKEKTDKAEDIRPEHNQLNLLRSFEDKGAQNPFSAVGFIRPDWLRRMNLKIILFIAQIALRHIFNRGNLAGVKFLGLDGVDTIHFARWVPIDDGRRLIFASNYDGSLESYMGDFIDKVAWGLNLVFTNGWGYPNTRWLVHEGANDEEAFKNYIRNHQLITQVWYTPYRHLTAVNIANNEAIRSGLYGVMNEEKSLKWLQRF